MYFAKSYKKNPHYIIQKLTVRLLRRKRYPFRSQKDYSCNASVVHMQAIIVGSKLYYCGLEAILLWARNYVPNVVTL